MFDSVVAFVTSTGHAGIALLMFAENIFPPIPSELIMPLAGFTAAWTTLLAALGYVLEGQYERVAGWVDPIANLVVLVLVVTYLFRVATFDRRRRLATAHEG